MNLSLSPLLTTFQHLCQQTFMLCISVRHWKNMSVFVTLPRIRAVSSPIETFKLGKISWDYWPLHGLKLTNPYSSFLAACGSEVHTFICCIVVLKRTRYTFDEIRIKPLSTGQNIISNKVLQWYSKSSVQPSQSYFAPVLQKALWVVPQQRRPLSEKISFFWASKHSEQHN